MKINFPEKYFLGWLHDFFGFCLVPLILQITCFAVIFVIFLLLQIIEKNQYITRLCKPYK